MAKKEYELNDLLTWSIQQTNDSLQTVGQGKRTITKEVNGKKVKRPIWIVLYMILRVLMECHKAFNENKTTVLIDFDEFANDLKPKNNE